MSLPGKLLRGLKWHNFRNIEGKYSPDVASDPNKMEEINFYLDFVKNKDTKKVSKILEQVRLCDLSNKPKLMILEAKKLEEDLYSDEYKKELAEIEAKRLADEEKARKLAELEAKKLEDNKPKGGKK